MALKDYDTKDILEELYGRTRKMPKVTVTEEKARNRILAALDDITWDLHYTPIIKEDIGEDLERLAND